MQKHLLLYAVCVTALLLCNYRHYRIQNQRLTQNQNALTTEATHYRTRAGEEAASAQVLRLRCAEFEELRANDAERIHRLDICLRRLEAIAKATTTTVLNVTAPLHDTVIVRLRDALRLFRWRDA